MNEKTKLLELFKKAADSADMFKDDKREVMAPLCCQKKERNTRSGRIEDYLRKLWRVTGSRCLLL